MGFLITWLVGGVLAFFLHRVTFRIIFGKVTNHNSYAYKYAVFMCGDYSWNDDKSYYQAVKATQLIALGSCFIPYCAFWIALLFLAVNFFAKKMSQSDDATVF